MQSPSPHAGIQRICVLIHEEKTLILSLQAAIEANKISLVLALQGYMEDHNHKILLHSYLEDTVTMM